MINMRVGERVFRRMPLQRTVFLTEQEGTVIEVTDRTITARIRVPDGWSNGTFSRETGISEHGESYGRLVPASEVKTLGEARGLLRQCSAVQNPKIRVLERELTETLKENFWGNERFRSELPDETPVNQATQSKMELLADYLNTISK